MSALKRAAYTFSLLVALGTAIPAWACSTCGCAASGTDVGGMQTWGANSLGLQYRLDRFVNAPTEFSLQSRDYLSSVTVLGIWSPAERWQIQAQVPYRWLVRESAEEHLMQHGLGDTWLISRYAVFRSKGSRTDNQGNWVSLGGGVKLPTGRYREEEAQVSGLPVNGQLGSGSVDFLAELQGRWSREAYSLNGALLYRHNLENPEGYRFGKQYSLSVEARRQWAGSQAAYGLLAGAYGEHFGQDSNNRFWRPDTGGDGVFAVAGAFANWGDFSATVRYRLPVWQDYAGGQVEASGPLDALLIYRF